MTALRAIGPRAFIHAEIHTTKTVDKPWEGKLFGFSPNSRSYLLYHGEKGTYVKSRNVTFIEPPPGVRRTQADERHHD